MLVPLHGFLQGDTVGLLLLVQDTDTLAYVARTLIDAAAVRVAPARHARVFRAGVELRLTETVASAGLRALERIDLVPDEAEPSASARSAP
ncbi:MAG TPA: toluene-4-monooxygenase system B family protein [Polyangiaceae bacterium]|nr:toluene-4-monooxygenase system B family protein [Polyangiaceae bacterium]